MKLRAGQSSRCRRTHLWLQHCGSIRQTSCHCAHPDRGTMPGRGRIFVLSCTSRRTCSGHCWVVFCNIEVKWWCFPEPRDLAADNLFILSLQSMLFWFVHIVNIQPSGSNSSCRPYYNWLYYCDEKDTAEDLPNSPCFFSTVVAEPVCYSLAELCRPQVLRPCRADKCLSLCSQQTGTVPAALMDLNKTAVEFSMQCSTVVFLNSSMQFLPVWCFLKVVWPLHLLLSAVKNLSVLIPKRAPAAVACSKDLSKRMKCFPVTSLKSHFWLHDPSHSSCLDSRDVFQHCSLFSRELLLLRSWVSFRGSWYCCLNSFTRNLDDLPYPDLRFTCL